MAELGSSPVADFSKIAQTGLAFSEKASQRSAARHQNVVQAFEKTEQERMQMQQNLLMLPPEAAAQLTAKVEMAMEERSKAIMAGSSILTGQTGKEFTDIAMTAAKISAVNKDLVDKYEKVRQSSQYLTNKDAYDAWFDGSKQVLTEAAAQGLDGAAQLDFFQPPTLQPDVDVISRTVPTFQRDFNPQQYVVTKDTGKVKSVSFDEKKAKVDASSFAMKQYDLGLDVTRDIDYQSVLRMYPEAGPDEVYELVSEFKSVEDELASKNIKRMEDIDAIDGITASEARRLRNGMRYLESREGVMNDYSDGLVNSIRFNEKKDVASDGGAGRDYILDFGRNRGGFGSMGFSPAAIQDAGYAPNQIVGYSSTKGGTKKQYGNGVETRYYEGLIYDGKDYKVMSYRIKPDFLQTYQSLSPEEKRDAVLDETKFDQVIEPLQKIRGDIPAKELAAMQQIAQEEYSAAKSQVSGGLGSLAKQSGLK